MLGWFFFVFLGLPAIALVWVGSAYLVTMILAKTRINIEVAKNAEAHVAALRQAEADGVRERAKRGW